MTKLNDSLCAEAMKLANLLSAIRPYKAFQGSNNMDKLCKVLEVELDRVCGRLMEGQNETDAT